MMSSSGDPAPNPATWNDKADATEAASDDFLVPWRASAAVGFAVFDMRDLSPPSDGKGTDESPNLRPGIP